MTAQYPTWLERAREVSARTVRVLSDELGNLHPSKVVAELATAAMPHLCFIYLRTRAWRAAGLNIGERSRLMGLLHVTGRAPWQRNLTIGSDTLVTGPLHIDLEAPVHIGNRVRIGHDVMLLTVDHRIGTPQYRCGESFARPITIGDGSWLGSRVIVLPGVSIGKGAVVAAGAVVTHDVPADTLVGGVPARVMRPLSGASDPVRVGDGNELVSNGKELIGDGKELVSNDNERVGNDSERLGTNDSAPDSGRRRAQANADTSRSPLLRALS